MAEFEVTSPSPPPQSLNSLLRSNFWGNKRDLIWHWRHRMPTIQIWNAVMYGITNRVARILYGPACGTDKITL